MKLIWTVKLKRTDEGSNGGESKWGLCHFSKFWYLANIIRNTLIYSGHKTTSLYLKSILLHEAENFSPLGSKVLLCLSGKISWKQLVGTPVTTA